MNYDEGYDDKEDLDGEHFEDGEENEEPYDLEEEEESDSEEDELGDSENDFNEEDQEIDWDSFDFDEE